MHLSGSAYNAKEEEKEVKYLLLIALSIGAGCTTTLSTTSPKDAKALESLEQRTARLEHAMTGVTRYLNQQAQMSNGRME